MNTSQIAVQFYTLRDACQTREGFIDTCRRVQLIGYEAVEISGVNLQAVPIGDVAGICNDHGLTICSMHDAPDALCERPDEVIARAKELGSSLVAYPYPAGIDFLDESSVSGLIRSLSSSGRVLADHGITLIYHNHHHEFQKLNGKLILERIFEETDPKAVQAELDTYWVQFGGGNPAEWCTRLAGRLPALHLKDYRINKKIEIDFAEVGAGNLDMPGIIRAAEAAGCRWFIVEQDQCPGDPFVSIQKSFDNLTQLTQRV